MEGLNFQALFYTLAIFFAIHSSTFSLTEARNGGFSVDLISRDSPQSPFYKPFETKFDRLREAFRRSLSRPNHFRPKKVFPDEIESNVISNGAGEYLMNISVGSPPVPIMGIVDSGSDLIWTQCQPCTNCYDQVGPLFDPSQSSSYQILSCDSQGCGALSDQASCSYENTCTYSYSYQDGSSTSGDVASETFTFGSTTGDPVQISSIVFGCGHDNEGDFHDSASGLIGLGGGPVSLISQLSSTIDGKFSYCLVPIGSDSRVSSKLHFGSNAVVSGPGVASTSLVSKDSDTFYYVTLEGMSIGSKRLAYKGFAKSPAASPDAAGEGNIIMDSGTTLTLLPQEFYKDLISTLEQAIGIDPVKDPEGNYGLCYSNISASDVPIITAHFRGGDVELKPLNTFLQVQEDLVCFTMVAASGLAFYGNLAQMNFLVGYDLAKKTVSFKATDCTRT